MRKSSIVLAISILLIFSIISIVDAKDISFESSSDSKEAEKAAKEASKVAEKAAKEASKAAKESEKDNKKAAKEAEKVEKEATKESEKAEKEASKTAKDAGKNSKSLKKVENYIFIGENQERIEVQIRTETKTKNGETYQKIKILGVEAVSELKLEKESSGKIKAELSNGLTKEIKLMPNTASKIALAKLQSQNRTLELKEVGKGKDSNIVYISEANKTIKFLGLFKSQYELTAMIDSETGEIIDLNGKPWWSFLAEEEIEEEIQTLALQLIQPLEDISILKDNNIILNLDDYFFNAKEYSLSESEFIALDLEDSKLTITPEENWTGSTSFSFTAINGEETLENSINVFVTEGNLSIQTTQYSAIVGENVKWKKEFKLTKKDKLNIKLPANSKNITLYKLDENKNVIEEETLNDIKININPKEDAYYALEYLTPEPQIFEDEISPKNKKIIVKGIDEAHYIDVIAFNYLETEAEADEIKLYRLGKNNRKEVSINKYDLNENGLIDYVEWIVPQLSDETYELIIEITKADHLDENKVFLSDIYDSVNALDDTWSELITNNHFVRITFENELTNKRDITVYSRADSTSSIENVTDSDSKEVIVGTATIIIQEQSSSTTTSSGGGGGGGGNSEYRETSEILEIVRGTTKEFPITINNPYNDSIINNITISTEGYYPQHIKIKPESISEIKYGKNKTINLIIYAPDYLDQGNYSLKLTISGAIVQGNITKTLTDKRKLILLVQEYARDEVLLCQNESINYIEEMKFENFSTAKVEKLLAGLDNALNLRNNNLAFGYCTRIQETKINAFLTAEFILEVMKGIDEAEARRLEVPETKELLNLAKAAFDREDYETAQERIKDAQMSLFLETKGRMNLLWFVMSYWWIILIAIISLVLTIYLLYKEILIDIINRKIKNLRKEENTISKLIRAAQRRTYDLKKMSSSEYHKIILNYEVRLNKIRHERIKLRHRRVAVLSNENEIKDIHKEHKNITNLMKNTQRKYFEKGSISRQKYLKENESHAKRLAEIEEERATLETKISNEKQMPKLFPLDYIKNLFKSNKKIKVPKKIETKISKLERDVLLKATIKEAKKPRSKKLKWRKPKKSKVKVSRTNRFSVATRQKVTLTNKQEHNKRLKKLGFKIK